MSEELTQNDAQESILETPFRKELEDRMPASARAQKLVDLTGAKEIKVFAYEGKLSYSKELEAHDIQLKALQAAMNAAGDNPKAGMRFEGANGEQIVFEMYFGGKEQKKDDRND